MNIPHYARLAAKLLAGPRAMRRPTPQDRERSLETLQRAMHVRQRRVHLQWLASAAIVMLAVGGGFALTAPQQESARAIPIRVSVAAPDHPESIQIRTSDDLLKPLGQHRELERGSSLVTEQHPALLLLSSGTRLNIGASSEVAFLEAKTNQRFSLKQGALRAQVAKLPAGERFIVSAPDAEIEVHGTAFELAVAPADDACSSVTRLRVTEGVVEVRANHQSELIYANQHWPRNCAEYRSPLFESPAPRDAAASQESIPEPNGPSKRPDYRESKQAAARHVVKAPSKSVRDKLESHASSSVLAEQSKLFSRGVEQQRSGRSSAALRSYGTLVRKFPNSALAEGAMAARLRILRGSSRTRAKAEARRYLARYPKGFAAKEARSVLGTR